MKKFGIFSGAFNPIHDGHLDIARSSRDHLGLDEVYLLSEESPWGDKNTESIHHRKAMVELAITDERQISQLSVGDARFTIGSTLPKLEQILDGELYFILGADVFMKMNSEQWPGLEKLLEHYIVVFERGDVTESQLSDKAKELGIVIAIIPSGLPHHSSSDVRAKIHQKSLWLPEKVADYIDSHDLYQ